MTTEERHNLYQEFQEAFPLETLKDMTLDTNRLNASAAQEAVTMGYLMMFLNTTIYDR